MCCTQGLQDAEDRAAAAEQQASAREQELQAQVATLKAEAQAREESATALEARLQEALESASSAAVDRRRLEAKLQQHSEVCKNVKNIWVDISITATLKPAAAAFAGV